MHRAHRPSRYAAWMALGLLLYVQSGLALPSVRSAIASDQSDGLTRVDLGANKASVRLKETILNRQVLDLENIAAAPKATDVHRPTFLTAMAFLYGFFDVICERRFGCHVIMMTGNSVKFATALTEWRWKDALFMGSVLGGYTLGVSLFRILESSIENKHNDHHAGLCLFAAPVVVLLFGLVDVMDTFVWKNALSLRRWTYIPLMALGSGVVNSASTLASGGQIMYAMTGKLNKLGESIGDVLCGKAWGSKAALRIASSFLAGIASSVALQRANLIPQLPLSTTVGALYALVLAWYGMSTRPSSRLLLHPSSSSMLSDETTLQAQPQQQQQQHRRRRHKVHSS